MSRIHRGIRLAVINEVSKTFVKCTYLGDPEEKTFKCPLPQPYAGTGGGILVGPEVNSVVLVALGKSEQTYIVGSVPLRRRYFENGMRLSEPYNTTPFPELQEGQIMLKTSFSGSTIDLQPYGNIVIDANLSVASGNIELSPSAQTLFFRNNSICNITEAGRSIDGPIRRDKNKHEDAFDSSTIDFLNGEEYETLLSTIARSPDDEEQIRTNVIGRETIRNPALVEKRSIIYEYADSFKVKPLSLESSAVLKASKLDGGVDTLINPNGARANRRTDIMNLNMYNFNHLIEKVEGTVVDIYGNVLDINRNVVKIPRVTEINTDTETQARQDLQNLYRYMRRSIKYHFEINSRKDLADDEPPRKKDNQRDHSRWSVDVDGEGLTKINIPASSNTGNIPLLGRYVPSVPTNNDGVTPVPEKRGDGNFKADDEVDVQFLSFGESGPSLGNSATKPGKLVSGSDTPTAGTAYHNMMDVANLIKSKGWHGTGSRMTGQLNNKIDDSDANAGGRSLHANLDGSAEISIGADTADSKSLVLDLEGGMLSHYGSDQNGRSVIHQSDGDVIIQIGDGQTTPGRLEIHLGGFGEETQKVVIDEMGITIDVQGNAVLQSSGDFSIIAGARLLLHGEMNFHHGSCDTETGGTRAIQGTESLWLRTGIPNHW